MASPLMIKRSSIWAYSKCLEILSDDICRSVRRFYHESQRRNVHIAPSILRHAREWGLDVYL
ncbi:hypothetical protein M422DRAFT_37775, partial [Sphaerobolus stellatus SS14]